MNNNNAVKAIIYNSKGEFLMQLRDNRIDLPFHGHWNFFGGLVEPNEPLSEALKRELEEELGCIPGKIGDEIFKWVWASDWASTLNHFFLIPCEVADEKLVLQEGEAMRWFTLEELVSVPLTPAVYENFLHLAEILDLNQQAICKFEIELLSYNNLKKKNERVFYACNNPCGLSRQQIFLLKALASMINIPVFRVCLHTDDQADVHEMIMIHTQPSSVGPLKQNKSSLSYHIIEGSLNIELLNENGDFLDEYYLCNSAGFQKGLISLRLIANQYRIVKSRSIFAIFLEVASGPFEDNDTHWLNFKNKNL